ncbi:MAG TPA: squalene/phytoene synthase family protein [Bryobacteraceae bacterium]|nr:squalene/phytoene synthase family protein [Bryobacteraceae bacterium]
MTVSLEQSYAYCRRVARTRARNFYYSFILLSAEQKDAMCAMYAFMRFCDDLSDEAGATRGALARWRAELDDALQGRFSGHPVWPAFHDSVRRYIIPSEYFHEIIDGVSSDLDHCEFATFEDLYRYCYQVASAVGLAVIHIFGFESPRAPVLAEKCGIAFQLTNILRDVREDADKGRVYLPREDLARFGVDPTVLRHDERFVRLMQFEAQRARQYYEEARPLLDLVAKRSRPSLWALMQIYSRLLERIERSDYDVLKRRIRLPWWEKLIIAGRALSYR